MDLKQGARGHEPRTSHTERLPWLVEMRQPTRKFKVGGACPDVDPRHGLNNLNFKAGLTATGQIQDIQDSFNSYSPSSPISLGTACGTTLLVAPQTHTSVHE